MARADLHVHSKYSNHPSEWFLQRIGASESYTDPEYIYETAKAHGMDYVTISDHNCIDGALALRDRHPGDVFISTEATAYFPEDQCKIHVLVYGIDEARFAMIQSLRTNIYDLRDYLRTEGLAHSVAHATYSINNRLTVEHLEKLILLFDVFEGINGGRSRLNNRPWEELLRGLNPTHIARLRDRHDIEPFGATPWIKGFTGGSDDHAGLFIGNTCTNAQASSIADFLDSVRHKRSTCEGRYSDFQSLAFTIYKIAYEFSRKKSNTLSQSLVSQLTESLFDSSSGSFRSSWKMKTYKTLKGRANGKSGLEEHYWNLFDTITKNRHIPVEERLDEFYDQLALISDEFFKILLTSLEGSLHRGDFIGMVKNVSSSLPGIFLTIPFFSTLKHFFQGRHITADLAASLDMPPSGDSRKVLWFTDTVTYMNGVSTTVKKIAWLSYLKGRDITLVTAIPEDQVTHDLPPNLVNLPFLFEFGLPHYEHYILRVPSLLRSIKQLHTFEPDEIYISTPGPVGLFGILAAKLLNAKCTVVFHTDFTEQAHRLIDDSTVENLVENYLKWFNALADEVQVPTREYINILGSRGYDTGRMSVFSRGIDTFQFTPAARSETYLADTWNLPRGVTFMYAGRISKDKNVDFLINTYLKVRGTYPTANLILAGEGPDLEPLRTQHAGDDRILFTGMVGHDILPGLYANADVFVFPSETDTFGMVVLEAQSCGTPAIVSDVGGPKEIIAAGKTGAVAPTGAPEAWVREMCRIAGMVENDPEAYDRLRADSRAHIVSTYDWNKVLDGLTLIAENGSDPSAHTAKKPSGAAPAAPSSPLAGKPDKVGV